jgi:hypothetical protein
MGQSSPYTQVSLTGCSIYSAHNYITCTVPAGIGLGWVVLVTVGGQTSTGSTASTWAYQSPTITGFGTNPIPTDVTLPMIITGTNFGPTGTTATVVFGPPATPSLFTCSSAVVPATAHTQLTCTVPAGYGLGHIWTVTVGGQTFQTSSLTTRYSTPTISGVTGNISPSDTLGGQQVTIAGLNYGLVGSGATLSVFYTNGALTFTPSCSVTANHYQITCTLVPGSGASFVFYVTVAAQQSGASTCAMGCVNYPLPIVTSVIFTPGMMNTAGSQAGVTISGTNFGMSSFPFSSLYGFKHPCIILIIVICVA